MELHPRRRLVVHQPYFFPWMGYFAKIAATDVFLCLDRAPFRRQYLCRTSFLNPRGEKAWLTLPLGAKQGQSLSCISLPEGPEYTEALLRRLWCAYRRAGCFESEWAFIAGAMRSFFYGAEPLGRRIMQLTTEVANHLGLDSVDVFYESDLRGLPLDRTARTIETLRRFGCDTLVCGDGASTRVHDLAAIREAGIEIEVIPYYQRHPKYQQVSVDGFVPGLSVVDGLLNVGAAEVRRLVMTVPPEVFHG